MKPVQKSMLRHLLNVVIVGGVTLALWPAGQTAYGWWSQRSLQTAWQQEASKAGAAPKPSTRAGKSRTASSKKALAGHGKPSGRDGKPKGAASRLVSASSAPVKVSKPDWPLTRLIIPDIGLDVVVVGGADEDSLRQGPGFVNGSAMPGEGNCVVAGHRNMYGSWLYRVDELWPESVIKLRTPRETFTYKVSTVTKVSEADTSVLQPPAGEGATPILTLITCTLPHTSDRVVVSAYLETEPTT